MLLVHGLGTTSSLWSDVIADLGRHVLTLAPDLAGTGRSEQPRGRLDLASQAGLLHALLDETGHDRVVVAGHGIGGAVAVHLAALAPTQVAGLVLCSSPVHGDAWPTPADLTLLLPAVLGLAWEQLPWARRQEGRGHVERSSGARGVARAVDMAGVEAAWRMVTAAPPPALVCWGERDETLHPSYGRRLVGELAGAAWVPVADAGHMVPLERPERVAEEVAAFCGELTSRF